MSDPRIPRFELHIRPMMRLIDREKMLAVSEIDLWNYDDVRGRADDILPRLKADMPPFRYGGPWPPEWIELFERWVNADFPRLELGSVDSAGYRAEQDGEEVTIRAQGTLPDEGYRQWLELIEAGTDRREYIFYWEPPGTPAGAEMPFRIRESFAASATLSHLLIRDADGVHDLPLGGSKECV